MAKNKASLAAEVARRRAEARAQCALVSGAESPITQTAWIERFRENEDASDDPTDEGPRRHGGATGDA